MYLRRGSLLRWSPIALAALGCTATPWQHTADPLAAERAVAADAPEHQPRWEAGEVCLASACIDERGLHMPAGHGTIARVALASFGRDGAMREAVEVDAHVAGPEARLVRAAGVTEWWRSLPSGLEHGVTFEARPAGEGSLRLEMRVAGDLVPSSHPSGIVLRDRDGAARARYGSLVVIDAEGRRLPATMVAAADTIAIEVDDAHARYPVVADPLLFAVEEATLRPGTPAEFATFGAGIAVDQDADVAAIAYGASSVIELFARTGASWRRTFTLTTSGTSRTDDVALSLSADGERLLVGAPLGSTSPGAGRVFRRAVDGTWAEEAVLTDATACGGHQIGSSVALDAAGSVAVLGAIASCLVPPISGEAFVFRRTGTSWAFDVVLTPPDTGVFEGFGAAVALSQDGSRVVVGAPYAMDDGLARVFVHDGGEWTEEGALSGSGGGFGRRVAIDDAGVRVVVGAPSTTFDGLSAAGQAHVFVRDGSGWTEEAVLRSTTPAESDALGSAVVISGDGTRVALGAPSNSSGARGSVVMFVRTGSAWVEAGRFTPDDAAEGDQFGRTLAGDTALHRLIAGVPSDDEPRSSGSARSLVWQTARAVGEPCGSSAECDSDFCVDGVCCETACSGGMNDCQACSAALTGGSDGACLPLSASAAGEVVCRDADGVCDAAEHCVGGERLCPEDVFTAGGTECRAPGLGCDPAEACTGAARDCPEDAVSVVGTVCHPTTGACDPAERCDGRSPACPADVFLPRDTECGGALPRSCTSPGVCDGETGACGGGVPLPPGTVCGARDPANVCDVDDVCTDDGVCPDTWAPVTTACGSAAMRGPCDAADHCDGMTGACIDAFLVDVECGPSAGACDVAERCSGDAPECPADAVAGSGVVCRASIDERCDPVESCDGVSAACAADVNECEMPDASVPDASVADAGPRDASARDAASDAGGPRAAAGCACRAGRQHLPTWWALVGLAWLLVKRRRC